jgi:hypothetical protein
MAALVAADMDSPEQRRAFRSALNDIYTVSEERIEALGRPAYDAAVVADPSRGGITNALRVIRGREMHAVEALSQGGGQPGEQQIYPSESTYPGEYTYTGSNLCWTSTAEMNGDPLTFVPKYATDHRQGHDDHLAGQPVLESLNAAAEFLESLYP